MIKNKRYIYLPFLLAVTIVIGIYIGSLLNSSETTPFSRQGGNKLDQLLNLITTQYVDTILPNDLIEQAIPQLVKALDPHSEYIPASDLEAVNEVLEGSFSGIGVQFNLMHDTINIVAVIPGGPSEKVGIMPGDRIVSVNDTAFVGKEINNEKVMKKLRGPKHSKVTLGIRRTSSKEELKFDIVRGEIPINSVDVSYMLTPNIGYIKINSFGRTTYDEFLNALAKLRNQGATDFVIDLRSNAGGYMDAAINMLNEFLPKNRLIVYTEGKAFPRNNAYSNGNGSFIEAPVVILVDEFSASASEIFAGAIQDNDRGTIVGRRTFGKGLVQQQIPFSDGSALRLTIARYYIPSGRSIQKEYALGDRTAYEEDIYKRFEHGEFYSKDSIKQIDSLRFETIGGRTVYGGGGIMPDYFIPRDTMYLNSYTTALLNKGLIYQFAFQYADQYRQTLNKYTKYPQLIAYLETQPILQDFTNFAHDKGVKRRPVYIAQSQNFITQQLYAYITRNILGEEAFYPIFQKDDNTINKAIELLNNGNPLSVQK